MNTIYTKIYEEAKKTFKYDLNDRSSLYTENGIFKQDVWMEWVEHWFKTANKQYQMALEENLTETSKVIKGIVELNKNYYFKK